MSHVSHQRRREWSWQKFGCSERFCLQPAFSPSTCSLRLKCVSGSSDLSAVVKSNQTNCEGAHMTATPLVGKSCWRPSMPPQFITIIIIITIIITYLLLLLIAGQVRLKKTRLHNPYVSQKIKIKNLA